MSKPTMKQIRAGWKERLLKAELPAEVVDTFLAGVLDEDLVRMKDLSDEQLMATLREALDEDDKEPKEGDEEDEDEETPPSTAKDNLSESIGLLADMVAERTKDMIKNTFGTVEVEVPELAQLLKDMAELKDTTIALKEQTEALAVAYKELTATWKDVSESDVDRIRSMVGDLSPAQRVRLRGAISEPDTAARAAQFKQQQQSLPSTTFPTPNQPSRRPEPGNPAILPPTAPDGVAIYDMDGKGYANLTDMAVGKSID